MTPQTHHTGLDWCGGLMKIARLGTLMLFHPPGNRTRVASTAAVERGSATSLRLFFREWLRLPSTARIA